MEIEKRYGNSLFFARAIRSVCVISLLQSFSSFERPTVDQIEQILADRDRLIRRTRVQRTKYRVLGVRLEEEQPPLDEKVSSFSIWSLIEDMTIMNWQVEHNSHLKETDEVFDDNDFYQQLLRQLIEQKTAQTQPGSADAMQNSIAMTR